MIKVYNNKLHSVEWPALNQNQILTSRQVNFKIVKNNRSKIAMNAIANRLHILNNEIPPECLNLSINTFWWGTYLFKIKSYLLEV